VIRRKRKFILAKKTFWGLVALKEIVSMNKRLID